MRGPAFRPCPMCGSALTVSNMHFIDCEGDLITDLTGLEDYEDMGCEENVDRMLGDRRGDMSHEDYDECVAQFRRLLEDVEYISIDCLCGFSYCTEGGSFPRAGWLGEFAHSANRRCARCP